MKSYTLFLRQIFTALLYTSTLACLVYAADYSPGETISPNCMPTDPDCTVTAPAISGANNDITSLSGLTTPLSITQGGIGMNSIPANTLLYASALNTLSTLSFGSEGQVLKIVSGALTWSADSINTYTAGTGLALAENVFSVANSAITSAHILDASILNADIATNAAIAFSKLNITKADIMSLGIPGADTDTNTTYSAGTGLVLTDTVFSIASTVLTNGYLDPITFSGSLTADSFIGDGSALTGVTAISVANDSITSSKVSNGSLINEDISSSASIDFSKLNITQANILGLGIPASTSWASWTPTVTGLTSPNINTARYKTIDGNTVAFELVVTGTGTGAAPTFTLPQTPANKGAFGTLVVYGGSSYASGTSFINSSNKLVVGTFSLGSLLLSNGVSYEVHVSGTYEY